MSARGSRDSRLHNHKALQYRICQASSCVALLQCFIEYSPKTASTGRVRTLTDFFPRPIHSIISVHTHYRHPSVRKNNHGLDITVISKRSLLVCHRKVWHETEISVRRKKQKRRARVCPTSNSRATEKEEAQSVEGEACRLLAVLRRGGQSRRGMVEIRMQ